MPTYAYACGDCGGFDAIRSMSQRDEPSACPACGAASPRVLAGAPGLACVGSQVRAAMETNERAQHAPRSSRDGSDGRMRHPAGCGCCSTGGRKATVTGANGAKAFPGKRPWMISH
ncbi:MAG: zinc ribbon domain-containing protein [Ramlibacter sp.]